MGYILQRTFKIYDYNAVFIQHCPFYFTGVYAVIDLYGQCAQVTITSGSGVRPAENRLSVCTADIDPSLTSPLSAGLITIVFTKFITRNYKKKVEVISNIR